MQNQYTCCSEPNHSNMKKVELLFINLSPFPIRQKILKLEMNLPALLCIPQVYDSSLCCQLFVAKSLHFLPLIHISQVGWLDMNIQSRVASSTTVNTDMTNVLQGRRGALQVTFFVSSNPIFAQYQFGSILLSTAWFSFFSRTFLHLNCFLSRIVEQYTFSTYIMLALQMFALKQTYNPRLSVR